MTAASLLRIEVVYALPHQQALLALCVEDGTTVETAIRRSGVLEQFPEIDLTHNKVGIFSKPVKLDRILRDKDRVEIYRPLFADPKVGRRRRADEGNKQKRNEKQLK